jgi:SHS2 domain-containing protein
MNYKFLPHTADIKFRAYGTTIEKAFENSAVAMFSAMYKGKIKGNVKRKISANGKDLESLLYDFLEKLLILLDSENLFLSKVKVKIEKDKFKLTGEVVGNNAKNYKIGLDVKAVTYNDIFVKKINGRWVCQVVIDV